MLCVSEPDHGLVLNFESYFSLVVVILTFRIRIKELRISKIISSLTGTFFIFLGFYWILVYWWVGRTDAPRHPHHDFSPLAFIWWLLSLYFTGIFLSLLTETLDQHLHNNTFQFYNNVTCNTTDPKGNSNYCYDYDVLLALISMGSFLLIYLLIFVVLTLKKYFKRRWDQYMNGWYIRIP